MVRIAAWCGVASGAAGSSEPAMDDRGKALDRRGMAEDFSGPSSPHS